ncbi:MAG TPA: hypothetical protein VFQ77_18610 [Pseudonocardiaceae bacterium]|nr:hypothetical protein [Pseudonocardiaceae bacterium]
MSPARPLQQVLLAPAVALLRRVVADADGDPRAAQDVLEAAASQVGGFDLEGYREVLDIDPRLAPGVAVSWAGKLLDLVDGSGVPTRLALATLAQPAVTSTRRRTTGAYYTDFRLAQYLARRTAQLAATPLTPASTIIDTAAGTGILLVALAEQIGRAQIDRAEPAALRDLVAGGLSAVDLDPECRRGTVAALASLTTDLDAIKDLATRVRTADSLVADAGLWCRLSAEGRFDAVLGNPPWERLRVTRHETLLASGARRHYGADYHPDQESCAGAHLTEVDRVRRYADGLARRYPLLGHREVDLCQAFLALGCSLVRPGGSLGMLLPAGLIRGQGTVRLREHLLTNATEVDLTVLHNRSHFFGIDTRFKFLAVCAQVAGRPTRGATLRLRHSEGTDHDIPERTPVRITFADLAAARRDLTVPEVPGEREWRLFQHMTACGSRPDDPDSPWGMRIIREVDMTRDRRLFRRTPSAVSAVPARPAVPDVPARPAVPDVPAWPAVAEVPVVEGRMVHQYRGRAKTYVSGSGRTAIWRPVQLGAADAALPQFFVNPARLPDSVRERSSRPRVGFCDVVAQTNERTLQAALIAPGRVCGNKVPTLDFCIPDDGVRHQREMLFLAAANSFVVDWFVRRLVTTSLNFFILLGLPLPALDPTGPAGRRLVDLAERLVAAEADPEAGPERRVSEVAQYRAEIDLLICDAYRIDRAELPLLLADFPLLDRHQPALPGEARSTVTADLLTACCGSALGQERYLAATSRGALAYVPAELAR